MSRFARITFLVIVAFALTIVAGLDLRLAFASRDLANETATALDQHERHPNGIGVVTDSRLDEHERRAAALEASMYAPLDEHERRGASQAVTSVTGVPAALDEHERRAASSVTRLQTDFCLSR